jgi:hypothetical protein
LTELADLESFVKYFLLSEFTVNPDAYISSFYLYKNGANDKIHAGPVWDFDFALGNRNWDWQVDESFYSPYEEMVRKREVFIPDGINEESLISRLFYYLDELPEFHNQVIEVFRKNLLGKDEMLTAGIIERKETIFEAVKKDEQKWKDQKWDNRAFEEEFDYLMKWINSRYEFFEEQYGFEDEEYVKLQCIANRFKYDTIIVGEL